MSIEDKNILDESFQNIEHKSVLANYLEKSGLSLWLSNAKPSQHVTLQCEIVEESEDEDFCIATLHNCGCGGGNCSC